MSDYKKTTGQQPCKTLSKTNNMLGYVACETEKIYAIWLDCWELVALFPRLVETLHMRFTMWRSHYPLITIVIS